MVNSQPCINISKESIIKVIFLKNNNYEPKPQAVECSEHSVSGSFSAFRNCKKKASCAGFITALFKVLDESLQRQESMKEKHTLSDQPTDVTESPSTERSQRRVT